MKCQIQWIDSKGTPTPDTNDAVALISCEQITRGNRTVRTFACCAEHLARMPRGPSFSRVVPEFRSEWSILEQPIRECAAREEAMAVVDVLRQKLNEAHNKKWTFEVEHLEKLIAENENCIAEGLWLPK